MYAVEVRDHIMIAHSLPDPAFGPAQATHGATFTVDVAFFRETLSRENWVVDIGRAAETLKKVLAPLNYRNLDEIEDFGNALTTTEFLCRHIFALIGQAIAEGDLGEDAKNVSRLRVTLHESHVARAWYEGALNP